MEKSSKFNEAILQDVIESKELHLKKLE